MAAYGVTTVIDLWSESEAASSPSPFANAEPFAASAPTYTNLPLIDDASMVKLAKASDMFERYLMMLEYRAAAFGEIFSTLANSEGTVVFHCFAGKDRTGMVAAMSLALAGVDADSIAADYAETDSQMATRYAEWLAAAKPELLQVMRDDLRCPPERIHGILEHLDRGWGGVEGYLGHARERHREPPIEADQLTSSATASPKTSWCRSTSSAVVAGDISAMLWKGVMRIPRLAR